MQVTVLFFGHYRDIVPGGRLTLDLAPGATVADAANHLAADDLRFADLLAYTRTAVNADFTPADTLLADGDDIAFLPPMSGG